MFGRKDQTTNIGDRVTNIIESDLFKSAHQDVLQRIKEDILRKVTATLDAPALLRMDIKSSAALLAERVRQIINDDHLHLSQSEEARIVEEICDQMLGFGPLERLLNNDEVSDIMVNGARDVFIEVNGRIHRAEATFQSNEQLTNVCQRIVSLVGRHVDQSSPICDARLKDGSRVNVILPPLAVDGPSLTIRRFRKGAFTLEDYVRLGSISSEGAEILRIIARSRCNVLVSGGTGAGKTTLLNALANQIEDSERIVSCEDTAELQLKKSNLVRLESRPPNIEGVGEIRIRDLVKNCLRMRPDRIIVGEVRGSEAFDLLQAMNTGHDGSMGTLHANSQHEALSRLASMIMMGFEGLSRKVIDEMIGKSIDVIVHISRQRDGTRRIMAISDVIYEPDGQITLLDIVRFEIERSSEHGGIEGRFKASRARRPGFWSKLEYFDEQKNFAAALEAVQVVRA